MKQSSLNAQLSTMSDNPRRFQNHPLTTVEGVVLTRICYIYIYIYIYISKYLKKGHYSVSKGRIKIIYSQ